MMIVHIQAIPMTRPLRVALLAHLINQINRASRHPPALLETVARIRRFVLAEHEILGIGLTVFREIEGERGQRARGEAEFGGLEVFGEGSVFDPELIDEYSFTGEVTLRGLYLPVSGHCDC
jgi:hypothetical protein